jgi:hypothetical protein
VILFTGIPSVVVVSACINKAGTGVIPVVDQMGLAVSLALLESASGSKCHQLAVAVVSPFNEVRRGIVGQFPDVNDQCFSWFFVA